MQMDQSLQEGDIVCCWAKDPVSTVISCATSSLLGPAGLHYGPSHIATIGDYRGQLGWYESTTKCPTPCLYAGEKVSGFQVQNPAVRIGQYLSRGGTIAIYRMTDFARESFDVVLFRRLLDMALSLRMKYSAGLLDGAMYSGTRLLKHSRLYSILVPGVDLDDVFCSEIESRFMQEMHFQNRCDPRRYSPAGLIRELVRTGVFELEYRQQG